MEVRIVTRSKKKDQGNGVKKNFIYFIKGKELENKNKELQYIEDDVVFVRKDIKGNLQVKEYHTYDNLMGHLDELDKNQINRCLLINKFTNIFNLKKSYSSNKNDNEILNKIEEYMKLIEDGLKNRFEWLSFLAEVNDKLIIGIGNHSVFETDITLHHTYGIPYIPGSALKGVLKSYIIREYFKECIDKCDEECNKECEENANKDKLFIQIFGGKDSQGESTQGNVIFMDSFPKNKFNIKRDIMTPHHRGYYDTDSAEMMNNGKSKLKLPLDNDDTNPIHFLVVEKSNLNGEKLKFQINIATDKVLYDKDIKSLSKNKKILNKYKGKKVQEFILENLIDALNFQGIGSKTSVGYGYFDKIIK